MSLTPQQKAAVERSGQDACCVAGPGSGKTFVLVERFAWLAGQGVQPSRILAITFTEKAAAEIKERVVRSVRSRFASQPEIRRGVERAQVSTIHGFCHALLGEHAIAAGLDPGFRILDEMEAAVERNAAMEAVLNRLAAGRKELFLEFASRWKTEDFAGDLLRVWPAIRSAGGAPAALARLPSYDPMPRARALVQEIEQLLAIPAKRTDGVQRREAVAREWIARLGRQDLVEWAEKLPFDGRSGSRGDPVSAAIERLREMLKQVRAEAVAARNAHLLPFVRDLFSLFEQEYARRKRAKARLDFADLEEKALALLRSSADIRAQVQQRYDAVLMDELQDTNPIQWSIIDLVRRPGRFFAVGDGNQSIFGFRGAEPGLFDNYRDSVERGGGAIDTLDRNFRSRQEILDAAAGALVPLNRGVAPHSLVAARALPPATEPAVELLAADPDADDIDLMARRLLQLHGAFVIHPKDGPPRPARFSDMAVLVRVKSLFPRIQEAFARHGIPLVVEQGSNFFEEPAIVDLVNLLRVLHQPDDDIALFGVLRSPLFGASDEEIALLRLKGGLAPSPAAARLESLRAELRGAAPQGPLARFLDETGYLAALPPQGRADVAKFFALLDGMAAEMPGDLPAWLDHFQQLRAAGVETTAPIYEAGEAVHVLTMHKSKGLEFPIVALASLHTPPRRDSAPIAFLEGSGLGLRWRDPSDENSSVDDPVLAAIRQLESRRQEREADRLLYVAMTRAMEKLLLCWRCARSAFLSDWPKNIADALDRLPEGTFLQLDPDSLAAAPPPEISRQDGPEPIAPLDESTPETGPAAVTSLLVFERCPWRYYLQFVAGWPPPAEPAAGQAPGGATPSGPSFGSEVHDALAGAPASEQARAWAGRFTRSSLGRRAEAARRVFREFDFLCDLDGHLMRGRIDLWFEDGAGLVLVDYKTDRNLSAEAVAEYARQLNFYALAIEKLQGRLPTEAYLFDLRQALAIPVEISPSSLLECRAAWAAFAESRARLHFEPQPGAHCALCPYSAGACSAAHSAPSAAV